MDVGSIKHIKSSKGKSLVKRKIMVCDDSKMKIVCTIWGQYAQERVTMFEGQSILIENGILSDYNAYRSITVGMGTPFLTNPSLRRTRELIAWYNNVKNEIGFDRVRTPE